MQDTEGWKGVWGEDSWESLKENSGDQSSVGGGGGVPKLLLPSPLQSVEARMEDHEPDGELSSVDNAS